MKSMIERTETEELIKILGDNSPIGVCIIQEGKFCYINPAFLLFTGYSADELEGKDALEIVVLEDREAVRENAIKMLKGEHSSPSQYRVACEDGITKWVMETVTSIQYHGKRATLGYYMDITERKQAEEALCESEERYRELANSITDVFFAMDDHLRYTYWNKASEILTGIRAEDALGKSLPEIFPDMPGIRRAEKVYRDVLRTQQSQTFVTDYTDRDGRHCIFELSAYPSRDGISVFVRDITECKQAEEKLQESQRYYENLLNATHEPLQVVDSDLRVVYANEQYIKRLISFGIDTEIMGKPLGEVCPFLSDHVYQEYQVVFETGKPIVTEETTEIDGTECYTETTKSPVFNAAGDVSHAITVVRDITERKKAEKALRQSEERYRTILEETGDGYFETDLAGNFTFVNDAQARLLGYSREELIGATYRAFTPEENVKAVFEAYHRMYKTGEPLRNFPDNVIRKDGSLGFAETSAFPIRNDKGEIIGFRGVRRDITERKHAEEELQKSEERYRQLAENAGEAILVVQDGMIRFSNPKGAELSGYSIEELTSKSFVDFIHPDDSDMVADRYLRRLQGEILPQTYDFRAMRKDGAIRWAELTAVLISWDNNPAVLCFMGDITERKRAEEALQQSERNYRTLFDSAIVGKMVIDAETRKVVMANQVAVRTLGFSSVEEVIGVNPLDFILPDERPRAFKIIAKDMFEQDLRQTHEFRVMTKDGREVWISGGGTRVMHQGKLMGLASFIDITEQKQQNERLMLTDRLASIGELAAGAAHELNNPLTSIIGFSQLIMEKDIPDDIRQDMTFIYSEAQRAAGVTKNLLAFARKHKPVKRLNQINTIIEDMLKLRAYEHKIKDIEVYKQLASDLPESMIDYFQMQQVFFNIVINAEYFMIEAHDRGTLTITTEKQNGTVRISFADDGPGISPENLSQIFNPFFTTKETGKGTGLGLSICHGVVSEHGGQIYARNQPGEGATIFVELPINGR
jgi:PAS domain S-box-containing protein